MSDNRPERAIPPEGFIIAGVPHAAALKLTVMKMGKDGVTCKVPYDETLIGNPDTGVLHGGVITTLLDNTCGIAVATKSGRHGQIATLDLRIDYMRPATPKEDIFAFCECYKVTASIAFVRGIAYQSDKADPIASCSAAFMLGTKSQPGANLSGEA